MFGATRVTNTRFAAAGRPRRCSPGPFAHDIKPPGADLTTMTMDAAVTPHGVTELIDFALEALPRDAARRRRLLLRASRRRAGPLGRSPRYTLMVELGLLRAQAAGYSLPFDVDEMRRRWAGASSSAARSTPGDIGLMLWIDARRDGGRGEELAEPPRRRPGRRRRAHRPARHGARLDRHRARPPRGRRRQRDRRAACSCASLDQLLVATARRAICSATSAPAAGVAASPTSPPRSTRCSRSPSPAATGSTSARCPPRARPADRLLELQLPDGGWPWLFDAERGTVVERYEVYSVHQDAMAPMALFELSEATGDPRYRDAAVRGLRWIHGDNELGRNMVDRENRLVLRSIRRRRGPDRRGCRQDGRLARRPAAARLDRAPDRAQPDRPSLPLRLGARGLVRSRGRAGGYR